MFKMIAADHNRQIRPGLIEQSAQMTHGRDVRVQLLRIFARRIDKELLRVRRGRGENDNPAAVCVDIAGIPLAGLLAELIKIVRAPRLTMILYEVDNLHGQIYTDGRSLPKEFDFPAYLGYSIGHWEGDVFVVDTAGFNDKTSWI